MNSNKPKTCFVIMPFGEKSDVDGKVIPFDTVYEHIIKEVIEKKLRFQCVRSDEIQGAGWIHKDMLRHIILDDVVVVDISTLNPNVFYEFGVRHALRPSVTVLIRRKGTKIPFNIQGLRMIDYDLDIASANEAKKNIEKFIQTGLKQQQNDSLVFDVFPNLKVSW